MTTQQQFDEWYEIHGDGHSYHAQYLVWQHQQARIDALENKLAIAVEALNELGNVNWHFSMSRKIATEALKLIEVSE